MWPERSRDELRDRARFGAVSTPPIRELGAGSVRGIAVHTGARVASLASPGEVLVSSTVKDLVAGSGIEFTDRGVHELKGIPGEWRLYAAN
jgi:class 3 adenylate cyclase